MDTAALQVIRLSGEPRARGRMHGEHFRTRIGELLARWDEALSTGFGLSRTRYIERFFQTTSYEATTQKYAPRVIEEVRGIAEGAGRDYREMFAFQHINEEFELAPLFARTRGVGEACSTIISASTPERPPLLAQNLDLARYLDGFQVLLRGPCDESDGEILVLSVPGMISLMGMNSHGFAVCDNAVSQFHADPNGLPVFALYRLLLESRSLKDARALMDRIPQAVGTNWVMGDSRSVAMIERTGDACAPYAENPPLAYHTNHPLALVHWAERFSAADRPAPARSTYLRYAALHQRLQACAPSDISVETMKRTLSSQDDPDYPVSRGGGSKPEDWHIGFTLACNVFELHRGRPLWHLASGPPHETAFRTFSFD